MLLYGIIMVVYGLGALFQLWLDEGSIHIKGIAFVVGGIIVIITSIIVNNIGMCNSILSLIRM